MLAESEHMARMALPAGRLDMVLGTDTFNEADDPFALSYCLLSPERLNGSTLYAAPFFNEKSSGAENGMEKRSGEICRLLGKPGRSAEDHFAYARVICPRGRSIPNGCPQS